MRMKRFRKPEEFSESMLVRLHLKPSTKTALKRRPRITYTEDLSGQASNKYQIAQKIENKIKDQHLITLSAVTSTDRVKGAKKNFSSN